MKKISLSSRFALTLIEVCIGVVILSIVMAAVMNMFVGGLKGSSKGMAHLTNMQTAAIVMAQIEYDILRATNIIDPAVNASDNAGRWEFTSKDGIVNTVIYNLLPDGIERQEFNSVSGKKTHVFGKGLNLKIQFRHLEFSDPIKKVIKEGMWVELDASTKKSNDEEFKLKRVIVCKNISKQIP